MPRWTSRGCSAHCSGRSSVASLSRWINVVLVVPFTFQACSVVEWRPSHTTHLRFSQQKSANKTTNRASWAMLSHRPSDRFYGDGSYFGTLGFRFFRLLWVFLGFRFFRLLLRLLVGTWFLFLCVEQVYCMLLCCRHGSSQIPGLTYNHRPCVHPVRFLWKELSKLVFLLGVLWWWVVVHRVHC